MAGLGSTMELSVLELGLGPGVLHEGKIAEQGPTGCILSRPAHPHTARLIEAVAQLEATTEMTREDA